MVENADNDAPRQAATQQQANLGKIAFSTIKRTKLNRPAVVAPYMESQSTSAPQAVVSFGKSIETNVAQLDVAFTADPSLFDGSIGAELALQDPRSEKGQ